MERTGTTLSVLALAMAIAPLGFATAAPAPARQAATERRGVDLLPTRQALRLSRATKSAPTASGGAVSVEDVGDVDSFGRNLKWLGVTNAFLTLSTACDPASTDPCHTVTPTGPNSFNFPDAVRITLPGKSTHSLMCYWFSPLLTISYGNPTASPVVARLSYNPTLTLDNPVLDDPALIDPTTGVAFGGHLTTAMTSSEMFQVPLPAGLNITERTRDSAVCIAGFINRRSLTDNYGLTSAQVDEFFKKPTTIHLNVRGTTQYVTNASLVLGLRIIGD